MADPRMLPVNEWSCSSHDYPQQCECCERWDCDECATSSWVKVGEREASVWEDMLLSMGPPKFSRPVLAEWLLRG